MEKFHILHMFTAAPNVSPFDANMAADAGWHTLVPYTSLAVEDVPALVQDAMFSRSPSGLQRTGVFIGGRDVGIALEMLAQARKTMFAPFQMSVFADPSGAFTTAAGMIAAVETSLRRDHDGGWRGAHTLILGGTGPVGLIAAILASQLGSSVTIMSRSPERAAAAVEKCRTYAAGGAPLDGALRRGRRRRQSRAAGARRRRAGDRGRRHRGAWRGRNRGRPGAESGRRRQRGAAFGRRRSRCAARRRTAGRLEVGRGRSRRARNRQYQVSSAAPAVEAHVRGRRSAVSAL